MRFVTFSGPDGARRPGVIDGDAVRPFDPSIASLEAYIALDRTAQAAARAALGPPIPFAHVTLLAPLHPKKNVFCVGRNYLAHAEEGARARGEFDLKLPSVPTFFTKAPTAVAGPGAVLHLQKSVSPEYDWEAELAVVIGKRARDVEADDALSIVFGYTCLNDVSARDLQRDHQQWFKGKSLDDTCPIGPWIVDAADIADVQDLPIMLRVNGITRQNGNTSAMIFDVKRIIASLSRGMTLEPGDIIATGTPDGVGFAMQPPVFLQHGDVIDVEIGGIGTLTNTVHIA